MIEEDGKRKRVRKRVRKGKTEGEEDQAEAKQAGPSRPQSNHTAVTAEPSSAPAVANGKGPTLSFYQRTNPHKPSALNSLTGGSSRTYTVSIAIPGSIILNAQTPELQARLAGQIARSCAIFNVDEIVVFDEGKAEEEEGGGGATQQHQRGGGGMYGAKRRWNENGGEDVDVGYEQDGHEGNGAGRPRFDPNAFLARILQYVETPQYLRKALFPMHRDLRLAGLLAPLDCPHHLRFEDRSPYREGVTVQAPAYLQRGGSGGGKQTCYVDVGLRDPIACSLASSTTVPVGARVTVRMPNPASPSALGQLVSPREPVERKGVYWGYAVRLCDSLSRAISDSTFGNPYDFVVGTSERGSSLTALVDQVANELQRPPGIPSSFQHGLIVFGGLSGLEVAVERDASINATADDADQLFDAWINVVEGQGSRTIRTEEALLITLARLKPLMETLGSNAADK